MKRISVILLSFIAFFAPLLLYAFSQTTATATEQPELSQLSLPEFLHDMNMAFDEYLEIFSVIENSGAYPHFLEKNASRYEQFQKEYPDISKSAAIAYVNVNTDIPFYEKIQEVSNLDDVSLLVNKHHGLPAEWVPEDMVALSYGRFLREEAAEAFFQMREKMVNNGLNLYVVSSYREYSRQDIQHSNSARWYGLERADENLARAGHSEHQTGLALDILHRAHSGSLSYAQFEDTDEYAWLVENAYKYGFILRYPEAYTEFHGYMYEPWHWRYIGIEAATVMKNDGIAVYEEFYGKYLASDVLYNIMGILSANHAIAINEKISALESKTIAEQATAELAQAIKKVEATGRAALMQEMLIQLAAAAPLSDATQESGAHFFDKAVVIITAIFLTAVSVTIPDVYDIWRNKDALSVQYDIKTTKRMRAT